MGKVAMYPTTVFFRLDIYVSISLIQAALIASPKGGYSHIPSARHQGIFPEILHVTLCYNPPKAS